MIPQAWLPWDDPVKTTKLVGKPTDDFVHIAANPALDDFAMPAPAPSQPSPRRVGTWGDWLGYIALRCVVCVIQSCSLETCDYLCRVLARIVSDWTSLRRKTIDSNLELVYGRLSFGHRGILRRKMWHHLFLMVCEIAHAPRKIHRTNWRDHFFMPQKREIFQTMMDGRPSVLVTGHYGNFEVAGHTVGLFGIPLASIARPLDNPFVNEWINDFRSTGGQRILPKEGSSTAVQQLLEERGFLAILADQHAGGKGCWVDFFGHPTSCHKALALFVLSAKAPMIVNYTRRLDRPLRFEMGSTGCADPRWLDLPNPPGYLDSVQSLTTWYNARLEEAIRLAPEQYWWLHRRWREIPPAQLKRLEAYRASQTSAITSAANK
jgi:Kdo2-lipid IVA lauroyltransferase/acyltransferase